MATYINYYAIKQFIELDDELTVEKGYSIGETYMDYLEGKWVKLTPEQTEFHHAHPDATVEEVFNMLLNVHEETLEDVKRAKIEALERYDKSSAVNNFKLNGMDAWLEVEERLNYDRSIRAYKTLNIEQAKFVINGVALEIPVATAETLLSQIQVYADNAYLVTMQHKQSINALETIEAVNEYDFTTGYPEQLNFNLGA